MRPYIKVIIIISILLILSVGCGFFYLNRGLESIGNLPINKVDLSMLEDGIYSGEFNQGRFTNRLEVEVKMNRISNITIVEDVVFALPEVSRELFENLLLHQSNDIDVISGATVTSKAYLKAVENALTVE